MKKLAMIFNSLNSDTVIAFLLAYLCGSLPVGPIVAKISNLGDLRKQGSGNIGATNVARIGGKKLGLIVALLDGLKGFLPVFIAQNYEIDIVTITIICCFTVIGHTHSLWLNFKGGKGIATSIGTFFALTWYLGVIYLIMWLFVYGVSRISSFSSLVSTATVAISSFYFLPLKASCIICLLSCFIFYRHKNNIIALYHGTEKKI